MNVLYLRAGPKAVGQLWVRCLLLAGRRTSRTFLPQLSANCSAPHPRPFFPGHSTVYLPQSGGSWHGRVIPTTMDRRNRFSNASRTSSFHHRLAVSCTRSGSSAQWPIRGRRTKIPSSLARIHRWTPIDGVRTVERGEEVTEAMVRARIRVDGRLAGGLQALLGAPMSACRGCGERDWRDRTRQEALADWAGASLRGRWVGWRVSGGRAPSGWEWNGSQSGQGATELLLPGPALGKMQGDPACRAGEPSGQGEEPPPEGLGGHDLLT